MAFNFNWSPLTADENFYQRATEMLTAALNKSPKPPLIADDIIVTEMNLGNDPPELDILEIGDIAEDRFRGIFKMSYRGDAFLTLKTKVQANPMNTYLHSKPTFTSPKPLAAQSGLTIPLSITLSEFKLSGFIILVFSKQKGLTIVFRNDPLESLKVSSTFDPIQFVRDYLQKTIESQLRNLFTEELPAIIHRLSLRLWCPDQLPKENEDVSDDNEEEDAVVDPLSKTPADAVDAQGNLLDANELANLSLEGGSEMPSLFSQKNLLKIAALRDSQRTLSLFTPGLQTALLRATSGAGRNDTGSSPPLLTPSLSKTHSFNNGQSHMNTTTYTFSETSSTTNNHLPSRPSFSSATSAAGLSASGRSRSYMGGRKKKQRVVRTPLRQARTESQSTSCSTSEVGDSSCTDSASVQGPTSEEVVNDSIPEEPEDNEAGASQVRFKSDTGKAAVPSRPPLNMDMFAEPDTLVPAVPIPASTPEKVKTPSPPYTPEKSRKSEKTPMYNTANFSPPTFTPAFNSPARPMPADSILEQAAQQVWISKMASEIVRRVYDEKARNDGFWETSDNDVPPPYEPAR